MSALKVFSKKNKVKRENKNTTSIISFFSLQGFYCLARFASSTRKLFVIHEKRQKEKYNNKP